MYMDLSLNETMTDSVNDHDLIVAMHEQLKQVRIDIKDLKDGTSVTISDHETRLRRLELWGFVSIGALYAVQFWLNYIK